MWYFDLKTLLSNNMANQAEFDEAIVSLTAFHYAYQ